MKSGTINDTQVVSHHVVLNENIASIIVISMGKTLMFEFYMYQFCDTKFIKSWQCAIYLTLGCRI